MKDRAAALIGPLFLFASLTLGGSAQGVWTNLFLQLSAIAILVFATLAGRGAEGRAQTRLGWIVAACLAVVALQVVPLPPELWTRLPGRETVVEGFALLGSDRPWLPLSLERDATISAFLATLPALAMLAWVLRLWNGQSNGLLIAIFSATAITIVVGVIQSTQATPWYPYRHSSLGAATGLFANSNHMASLLLVSIPLLAAVAADQLRRSGDADTGRRAAIGIALAACVAAIVAGIILNGSLAVLLLGVPMLLASALIFLPSVGVRTGRLAGLIIAATAAGILAILALGGDRLAKMSNQESILERWEILQSSLELARDYAPWGSGLGTFPAVYRLQENPETVDWIYVNHAHNEYLELAIELGLPGVLLVLVFLAWWTWRSTALWRSGTTTPIIRAATLVTLGLLLHSLVDFPLRTAALSALFAAALGLMAAPPAVVRTAEKGRPRHLTLDDL